MEKEKLAQYRDLVREVKLIKKRLEKLNKHTVVHDKVSGSNPNFPYQQVQIFIEGYVDNTKSIERLEKILDKRLQQATSLKLEIEDWIAGIFDSRIRLIFELRYIHGKSWIYISRKFGSSNESYARNIHDRYLKSLEK